MGLAILDGGGYPQTLAAVQNPSGQLVSEHQNDEGQSSTLNVTAATVIKASPGRSFKISVLVAGSAPGTLNDCATTGAVATANEVGVIPNTVGVYSFNWPHATGIVLVPGAGQTLAISFT